MTPAAPPASVGVPPPGTVPAAAPAAEHCPLCGAALRGEQEWCLRCGAAARTRLAAAPDWKTPLMTLMVIGALALGILAAALVKLAGDSGPAPAPRTTTVTSARPAAAPTATLPQTGAAATSALPGVGTTAPAAAGATTGTTPRTPLTSATGRRRSGRLRGPVRSRRGTVAR